MMLGRIARIARCLPASVVIIALVSQAAGRAASNKVVQAGKLAALRFDPAQTTIAFTLTGWPHDTHGTFKLKDGTIRVDPVSGKMDGAIVVDAASANSGEFIRDARIRDGVLEVGHYPEISFNPQQVVSHGLPEGEFPVDVRGVMMLHGIPHPFTVTAKVERRGELVIVHCAFVITYVEWGLEDPSILMFKVAKQVDLDVSAVARLRWVSPAAAPIAWRK